MTNKQVNLLREVLTLYAVTIESRSGPDKLDILVKEEEFEEMVCALEDLTGLELDY